MKNQGFSARIGFALEGWRAGWRGEKSFRTQTAMAGLSAVALLVLRPAPVWWGLVALTCGLVLALELVNSAVEEVIDLLHPDIHPAIKRAKDMLAGAVLVTGSASLAVAAAMVVDTAPRFLAEVGL